MKFRSLFFGVKCRTVGVSFIIHKSPELSAELFLICGFRRQCVHRRMVMAIQKVRSNAAILFPFFFMRITSIAY